MQYKGEDLDLRVPHGRTPRETYIPDYETSNARWGRGQPYMTGPDPVWVDEILLACCNYAFDVAQANGSGEVALEHLVNAMTRVDGAARQLEARGVREGQLRRESAALIASEIPAANAGDAVAPRRSPELEDILRRAADLAQRRNAPAGIDDVLWVILHASRETPVVLLLRRLTPDWQRADWGRHRDPMPEPRAVQLVANEGVGARMASMEDSFRMMQAEFAAERKLLMDLIRDVQRDVVSQRGDSASFRSDLGQRLDGIERTVHTRGDVRMADRLAQLEKAVHGSLLETQRGSRELAQRLATLEASLIDHSPGHESLADRMTLLEKAVNSGLGEGARNWANLGQRLNQLEAAVERHETPTFDALTERLGALERTVQQSLTDGARNHGLIGQRLASFETLLGDSGSARLGEAMQARLAAVERRVETETQGLQARLQERFAELGRLIETSRGEAVRLPADVADRLSSIETFLMETPSASGDPAAVRELSERLGGLERAVRAGFGEAAATTTQIAERLVVVERGIAGRPGGESEAALLLDERLGAIERMLDTRGQQAMSINTQIAERLSVLEKRPLGEGGVATLGAEAFAPVNQRVEALQTSLGAISTRLDQLDERMRGEAVVTEEALRGRDQDFDFIYNEIKQLGQSQATLNSAVNDWRNESQEHFGALATRLDKLATPQVLAAAAEAARPIVTPFEVPAAIKPRDLGVAINGTASGPHLPKPANVSAQDYTLPSEPGRGFWYWLFGTPSVWKSTREHELRVDRMRQGIRDARERRRTQV